MTDVAKNLRDTQAWLREHRAYVNRQVHEGFDAVVDRIGTDAQRVEEMAALLKSAHEFMTGVWEPEDIDRARFVRRLAEFNEETQ